MRLFGLSGFCGFGICLIQAAEVHSGTVPSERFIPGEALVVSVPADTESVLNGGYPIDLDGFVDFPIVGKVQVGNLKREWLESNLGSSMSAYLKDTNVSVRPAIGLTFVGDFANPGLYYVHPDAPVWEAIRTTDGPGIGKKVKDLHILRGLDRLEFSPLTAVAQGKTLRQAGIRSGDLFFLPHPPEHVFWDYFTDTISITATMATAVASVLNIYLLIDRLPNN